MTGVQTCALPICKLKQFTHERIDERVCVPWLFWIRYDPNTKNVVLLEVLLWRKIVVENEEDPRSKLPPFKRSESIHGEAKCNIMMIQEVIVREGPISSDHTLFEKRAIMEPIEDICCHSGLAGLCMLIGTVLKLSGVGAIRH